VTSFQVNVIITKVDLTVMLQVCCFNKGNLRLCVGGKNKLIKCVIITTILYYSCPVLM